MRGTGHLAALRERNLALLVSSNVVSSLGSGMAQVALAFAVLHIGGASDLGLVLLAREIPIIVFLLVGGVWADRVSRKKLLVFGYLLLGASQSATAVLFLTDSASVLAVAALQIGFGTANAFTRPATTGLIAQAVRPQQLQTANALVDLSRSITRIAGPALGAIVVVAANPGWALAADAASFFVAATLTAQMRIREGARSERRPLLRELHEGWREFIAREWVWTMVASFSLFQLTLFPAMLVLGPVVAKTELGGAGAWGAILACQAVGAVIGGLVALRLRPSRPLVTACLLTIPTAIFLAMLGLAPSVWVLCLVGLLAGVGLTCTDILWFVTFQQRIPEHLLSRLSSFDWLGSIALNPIGYALVGPLSGAIGVPATLYGAAAVNAAVSLVVAASPSVRGIRASEVEPLAAPA